MAIIYCNTFRGRVTDKNGKVYRYSDSQLIVDDDVMGKKDLKEIDLKDLFPNDFESLSLKKIK